MRKSSSSLWNSQTTRGTTEYAKSKRQRWACCWDCWAARITFNTRRHNLLQEESAQQWQAKLQRMRDGVAAELTEEWDLEARLQGTRDHIAADSTEEGEARLQDIRDHAAAESTEEREKQGYSGWACGRLKGLHTRALKKSYLPIVALTLFLYYSFDSYTCWTNPSLFYCILY